MGGCPCCGASVAEWLERAVAVREVLGSSSGWDRHKKLCGRRVPSDYVIFRMAVKRQRFRTFKHTIHNNTPYKRLTGWNWISVCPYQILFTHFLPNDQWLHLLYD